MTIKAIGKTIKSPMLNKISNAIKKPIIKTFGSTIKKSVGMVHQNKNIIKNVACGLKEKYSRTRHNFGSKSIKYLREEGIKKFKSISP